MNILIRLILTILLVAWAVLPYFDNSANDSVLNEIIRIGVLPSLLIIGAFFMMVGFYCRTLQRCLSLINPTNRKAKPSSVWYMFAIPFNFIEDFFIVVPKNLKWISYYSSKLPQNQSLHSLFASHLSDAKVCRRKC
jgi:hypothetical protein